jgi:two-component system sensor histidine kinase PilS (NtrC family)
LHFLNLYRLTLAGLFLTVITLYPSANLLGQSNPSQFFTTSLLYAGISGINSFTIRWRKPPFVFQVYAHGVTDVLAITLLMHASGGLQSGLGILLVVAIAGGSLLLARRSAVLLAAFATLAILLEQTYSLLYIENAQISLTQAGLLGVVFFGTAFLTQLLARRVRESEALAAQRGMDLANMEQLTEYIIQRMQTGIVVVDMEGRVRLINESAWYLMGMPAAPNQRRLKELVPALATQLALWRDERGNAQIFRASTSAPEVLPRFARLGTGKSTGTLIFLENTAAMAQQAQQLKLASLGRLTASIAHEIRNPLGAISHAGQLLAESGHLDPGEQRMTQIILEHCKRMNRIVENVLQVSRRQRAVPEDIALQLWLSHFIDEFCQTQQVSRDSISLTVEPAALAVRFDPHQLHQILWNLCSNGLRYTMTRDDGVCMSIKAGLAEDPPTPFLDVVDFGPGISAELVDQIFEPFFTTDAKGTGLGLYISKELCEANQARLNYLPRKTGTCFRITFADIRRHPLAA